MKLALFTPLSEQSAIAEFSVNVGEALAQYADVTLWGVTADEPTRQTRLQTRNAYDAVMEPRRLNAYDVVVYNLGNYWRYHSAVVDMSRARRGTVILHDRTYHHLFREYWRERGQQARFAASLATHYGDTGRDYAMNPDATPTPGDMAAIAFPFVEEAVANAEGVVVHSTSHADSLGPSWSGPLTTLFLPSYPSDWDPESHRDERHGNRRLLVTFGHVNPNKQIHAVLQALELDESLARRIQYVVAGPFDPANRYYQDLRRTAESVVADVEFHGYLSDADLAALARRADIFVNLRYPNTEGSSASLIRQLAYGKPVLAYASGIYGETPEGTIALVESLEPAAIAAALTELLDDRDEAERLGQNGREWIRSLSPDRYALELLSFIGSEVRAARPLLDLADRVAAELASWGADPRLPIVDRVAAEIATLMPSAASAGIRFRRLIASDFAAVAGLFETNDVPDVTSTFDPFPMTRASAEQLMLQPRRDRFFGAFCDGTLVAFSMLRGWDDGFEIPSFGIFVDASSQGRGVGAQLTDWTIEQARLAGARKIRLSVYGSNDRAIRIYDRLGFMVESRTPIDRNGVPDERIVMTKELIGRG
jgi:glycosyltransferase involved in cell wall biosynthesis/ribosomal protein S18 acetylase RimI-like enzyme